MRFTPIALFVASALTACAPSTHYVKEQWPLIPEHLKADCLPLRPLATGLCPELAASMARDSLTYSDCAARHKALADAVRKREAPK